MSPSIEAMIKMKFVPCGLGYCDLENEGLERANSNLKGADASNEQNYDFFFWLMSTSVECAMASEHKRARLDAPKDYE